MSGMKEGTIENRLRLPTLINDGCVLQQGEATRIWGCAAPFQTVNLRFQEQYNTCQADLTGAWEVLLPSLCPGGPYVMEIWCESGERKAVRDVYVGEVFVCAGQSNMELSMNRVKDRYPWEWKRPAEPNIRLYKVKEYYDFKEPLTDHTEACWKGCSPEVLDEFSAVSYFFGRELYKARHVPIGLINVSLGGSPIEAWLGKEALHGYKEALDTLQTYQSQEYIKKQLENNNSFQQKWIENINKQDIGLHAVQVPWKGIKLPAFLKDAGLKDFCGCIWLRKKFTVPHSMIGQEAKLWLGTLVDSDKTYVNGVLTGETGYQYPPRKYKIPKGVLTYGENELCIRLICNNGKGRVTPGKTYAIFKGEERISLEGDWEYRIGCACDPAPETDFISRKPAGLYNGMLAPCLPYTVKGVVWYQGESNDQRPESYEELLKRLILFWRKQWKQEKLPFIVAQLPGFYIDLDPADDAWPKIREAQAKAVSLVDVAVTVNLDLGEWNDLHPLNKKDAAKRMALAARGMIYGESVVWKGPGIRSFQVKDKHVQISFDTGDGKALLVKSGSGLEALELAGADGRYYPVEGEIGEKEITVWCKEVAKPKFLRYAYSNAPGKGLLYNQTGLLAAPFCLLLREDSNM